MTTPAAPPPQAGPFAQILPTLSAGARGLRDLRSYATAATVLAMTIVPGILIWGLAFGLTARGFAGDPFGPGVGPFAPGPTTREIGPLVVLGILVWMVAGFGLLWAWVSISVRSVSLERGTPQTAWRCVTIGLRRALVALGGGLLFLLMGLPLLILYVIAWVMADVVVLSGVSAVLTMVLVLAIFVWWIGMLVVGHLINAFAAADERASVMTVLRRTFGLAISNPGAVILLLMSVWLVAIAVMFALYGPTFFAGFAGLAVVEQMAMGGRTISATLTGVFIILFFVTTFVLVPVNFAASALASIAVRIEPDLARIEAAGRNARKWFRGGRRDPASSGTWPSGPGQPPPGQPGQSGQPPSGPGPYGPPQGRRQAPPPQGSPPEWPAPHGRPPAGPGPQGPPTAPGPQGPPPGSGPGGPASGQGPHDPPSQGQPPQGRPPQGPPPADGPPPA